MTKLQTPNFQKDHVYLYSIFHSGTGKALTPSPFGCKLHAWLVMAKIPFTAKNSGLTSGPTGKIPFIELNGEVFGDTGAIIEMLTKKYSIDMDAGLTLSQKSFAVSAKRMLEEDLVYQMAYERFCDPKVFAVFGPLIFTQLSAPLKWIAPIASKRQVRGILSAQGLGRMPHDMIVARRVEDVDALAGMLGDNKFFMGDEMRTVDATVFGFMSATLDLSDEMSAASHLGQEFKKHANLMAYLDNMKSIIYAKDAKVGIPEPTTAA